MTTLIHPELRGIESPDLVPPDLPPDPRDCAVRFDALIGPRGGEEPAEPFGFIVVTVEHLRNLEAPTWGRGLLIVDTFSWPAVVQAIAAFLAQCARPTWPEVIDRLTLELHHQRRAD